MCLCTRRIQSALLLWLCSQQRATLVSCQTLSSISYQTFPKAFLIPSFKFPNVALQNRNIKFFLLIDPKEEIEGIRCGEPRDQKTLHSLSYAHAAFYCRMKSWAAGDHSCNYVTSFSYYTTNKGNFHFFMLFVINTVLKTLISLLLSLYIVQNNNRLSNPPFHGRKRARLTLRRLMSYTYGAPILDVSRSHTTTQHSR